MPRGIYDPDSEDEHYYAASTKFSLLPIIQRGPLGDIFMWRNKYLSAGILIGFSVVWFLFEVAEYHFVTLVCHLLIFFMSLLFIWSNTSAFIRWDPPTIDDIKLPQSTIRFCVDKINWALSKLYHISSGSDVVTFFVTIICLWIISTFGSLCDSLTLLYIVYVSLATIPAIYENYEEEVDELAANTTKNMKILIESFNTKVVDRIPRGPTKPKKLA